IPIHPVRSLTRVEHCGGSDLAVLALVEIRRRIREGHARDGGLAPVAGPSGWVGSRLVGATDAVELVVVAQIAGAVGDRKPPPWRSDVKHRIDEHDTAVWPQDRHRVRLAG